MTQEETIFIKHLADLAGQSYRKGLYTFSGFLNLAEQDLLARNQKLLQGVPYTGNGGYGACERVMVRFGSEENCFNDGEFPIAKIRIRPKNEKYAGVLSHRDYLGALMNLGLERDRIGDIVVREKEADVFCVSNIADFIAEKLDRIAHTSVGCTVLKADEEETASERSTEELIKPISSERIDSIVAAAASCSRSAAATLIQGKKVYVNQRLCESNSLNLKENDVISVRGYGKFRYAGVAYTGRKGKLHVKLEKYV